MWLCSCVKPMCHITTEGKNKKTKTTKVKAIMIADLRIQDAVTFQNYWMEILSQNSCSRIEILNCQLKYLQLVLNKKKFEMKYTFVLAGHF